MSNKDSDFNSQEIARLIGQLSSEQQEFLLNSLNKIEGAKEKDLEIEKVSIEPELAPKKQKIRRKHYKRQSEDFGKFQPKKVDSQKEPQQLEWGKRPNLFEQMPEFTANQKDSELDRKLWKNIKPSERRRKFTPVQATCLRCNKSEQVSPAIAHKDTETRQWVFTCNKCLGGLRGPR